MTKKVLKSIQGCLAGAIIGDAMGMPVETMTPEQILEATDGQGVTCFMNAIQRNFFQLVDFKAGDFTDDWQLTRAVARSLIRFGGYDQTDQALSMIAEFEKSQAGWGGTTKAGLESLKLYFDSRGAEGRHPTVPSKVTDKIKGTGNGVAMRIAPLAIFCTLTDKRIDYDLILQHGDLTHPDPRASIAAFAIAVMIETILLRKLADPFHKSGYSNFERVLNAIKYYEPITYHGARPNDNVEARLRVVKNILNDKMLTKEKSLDALIRRVKTGSYSLESVPFSLAVYLRHPDDFRAGVLEAVNAGGDTDTNASMVGAMIGANVGIDNIPKEWLNFRPEFKEALDYGEALYLVHRG